MSYPLQDKLQHFNSSIQLSENQIHISAQDKRLYRSFTLEENGLQVLCISDPETDKASAAMDVHVGHLYDPENLPGLAHFLEHMLFLGTEKYPKENSYQSFLNQHSGRSNAYTSMTDTNYYFDVAKEYLHQALDYFSQFFISPLFTESATEREMNAVNSENMKNLQSDSWRLQQLYKHVSNPSHPYHKFGTGNYETLGERPKLMGINIREELIRFYQRFYSAHRMKLVVYGYESLDVLESMVRDLFRSVVNTGTELPTFDVVHPFGEAECLKQCVVVPVKDLRLIELSWSLKSYKKCFLCKPDRYWSHLLGHEGKGSLLSLLKDKKWANEISAGLSRNEETWSMFIVSIEATEEGIEHVNEVVDLVYDYVHMCRVEGVKEWIFTETQQIQLMNFRFENKASPIDYTSSLAVSMQLYPMELFISGNRITYEFNPEEIESIADALIVDNMRLLIVSQCFDQKTSQIEPWYQTNYEETSFTSAQLNMWKRTRLQKDITSSLHLPLPNPLITTNFDLLNDEHEHDQQENRIKEGPMLILDEKDLSSERIRVFYKSDLVFKLPKLNLFCFLHTPHVYHSPRHAVLTDILVRCVKDILTEFSYQAALASSRYDIYFTKRGIEIFVTGFNEKCPLLVHEILNGLINFPKLFQPENFQRIHDKIKRSYANFAQEEVYSHAIYESNHVMEIPKWHNDEKLKQIDEIQLQDLIIFHQQLFQQVFMDLLFHGNITEKMSKQIALKIFQQVGGKILFPSQRTLSKRRIIQLQDKKEYILRKKESNEDNVNSAIQTIFQIGIVNDKERALIEVLAQILKIPCFSTLRTKEQLGYIVFSGVMRSDQIQALRFIIQSDKVSPNTLNERIEAFLEEAHQLLHEMTPDDFQKYVQAVVDRLKEKPETSFEESVRYWNEIIAETFVFNQREITISFLKKLIKEDVIQFFEKYIRKGSPNRKKLSTEIYGNKHLIDSASMKDTEKESTVIQIDNVEDFKKSMLLYPIKQ